MRVQVAIDRYYYPGVTVSCDENEAEDALNAPRVVVAIGILHLYIGLLPDASFVLALLDFSVGEYAGTIAGYRSERQK
jgi:hypothetical protein